MKTLLAAILLVGAFFLGAYVDRTTTDRQVAAQEAAAGQYAAQAPVVPDSGTYNPNQIPVDATAGNDLPPPATTFYPAPAPSPAQYRAQDFQGARRESSCLPDLVAKGMSYTSAAHVCGVAIDPIRGHR